ncbi:MAG: dTDP-glucose 4,6-dehydratase [Candidatus Schekmanbacteria bacterium]|nr:dTDP-glucose 4,6-dehydratase [Candidatus Schekmanbacteria bacterium]
MKLLVTGGLGFIGSNFVRYMLNKYPDYRIINLDKMTYAGNPANLADIADNPHYSFVRGDIIDVQLVEKLIGEGCDAVVNFAAETHVDRSIADAGGFITTDVYGTFVLLEAARRHKIKRFIQISTDEVYGEAESEPCTENAPLNPKSPYAASKAGADRLAFSYWATYQLPVIITRCSNNYGPYQYPEKMIPLFVTNALEDKPLPVYGDGQNTRDWIYVLEHNAAIDLLLHSSGLDGEVFNIGSGGEYSILQIAGIILKVLGKTDRLICLVKDRPGHVRRHAVNTDKIRRVLNWQSQISFEQELEKTIRWYQNNRSWWEPIKSGSYREYYRTHYGVEL